MHTQAIDTRQICDAAAVDHVVDTTAAAAMLGLAPQTLRRWSCDGTGPIRPRRLNGRLRWSVAEIRALLAG
jgi:hypothetical protein